MDKGRDPTAQAPPQRQQSDLSHAVLSGINMTGAVLLYLNMALAQSSAEMRSQVRQQEPFKHFAA